MGVHVPVWQLRLWIALRKWKDATDRSGFQVMQLLSKCFPIQAQRRINSSRYSAICVFQRVVSWPGRVAHWLITFEMRAVLTEPQGSCMPLAAELKHSSGTSKQSPWLCETMSYLLHRQFLCWRLWFLQPRFKKNNQPSKNLPPPRLLSETLLNQRQVN